MRAAGWVCAIGLFSQVVPSAAVAQVSLASEAVQEHVVEAGQTYAGQIVIRNASAEEATVMFTLLGYTFSAAGGTRFMAPDSQHRSNAEWVRLPATRVVVPPRGDVRVPYELHVPAGVKGGSTYWSMIGIEPVARAEAEPGAAGFTVRTIVRHTVQIATHVVGTAETSIDIRNLRVAVDAAARQEFTFELYNESEAGFRPRVMLDLYDLSGTPGARREAQRGLMYPGTSILQRFDLTDVPAGEYEALITIDTGSPDVFGAQFRLTIPAR